jgi:DNA-binding transcriptional regulator YhcF (GntR family)
MNTNSSKKHNNTLKGNLKSKNDWILAEWRKTCSKRNPPIDIHSSNCDEGYYKKYNKRNNLCCYKSKKKKAICSKRNKAPPCDQGYYQKKNTRGNLCCYKSKKGKPIKEISKNPINIKSKKKSSITRAIKTLKSVGYTEEEAHNFLNDNPGVLGPAGKPIKEISSNTRAIKYENFTNALKSVGYTEEEAHNFLNDNLNNQIIQEYLQS